MPVIRKLFAALFCALLLLSAHPAAPAESAEGEAAGGQPLPQDHLLRVHQINITCGDAYLITLDDLVIVVDCGLDSEAPISRHIHNHFLYDYLEGICLDHIDAVFITHWHNDHCYELYNLMEDYGAEDTPIYGTSPELWREFVPLPAGVYSQLVNGDRLSFGPLDFLCVGPEQDNLSGRMNIHSLNILLSYGDHTFLFTGDWVDRTVADRWPEEITKIDVLSFPHHGLSPICIAKKPYRLMDPRLILIPGSDRAGARKWVTEELQMGRDTVFLTARDGHIIVTSDGERLWYASGVVPGDYPLGEELPPRGE